MKITQKKHLNLQKRQQLKIEAQKIVIATGSKPATLPFIELDKERVITSTEALELDEVPKKMIVIGGGVIGLELGQVYKRLGSEVSVIEYMPKIIPRMDGMLSKELQKSLKKQGIKVTELKRRKRVKGEAFIVDELENSKRKFEGHFMARVTGKYVQKTKIFKKGDFWVDMAQPLTNLAFYMLEPQSDDGLVTWNFFDDYLKNLGVESKSVEYPVFKVFSVK